MKYILIITKRKMYLLDNNNLINIDNKLMNVKSYNNIFVSDCKYDKLTISDGIEDIKKLIIKLYNCDNKTIKVNAQIYNFNKFDINNKNAIVGKSDSLTKFKRLSGIDESDHLYIKHSKIILLYFF